MIDVGIHRNEQNKFCGDVDFDSVEPVCGAITPVPGGVGPMTIAMLMNNCLESVSLQAIRGLSYEVSELWGRDGGRKALL